MRLAGLRRRLAGWERADGRFEAVWSVEPDMVRLATQLGRHWQEAAGVVVVADVGAELQLDLQVRLALDQDPVAAALGPVGGVVVAQAGDVLDDDALLTVDHADDLEAHAGDRPLLDATGAISKSSSAWMISCVSCTSSSCSPMADATRWRTGPHAREVDPGDRSSDWDGSGFPNPMIWNIVKGLSQVS